MRPDYILDLETTGLLSGYGQPRRDVGISEWALLPRRQRPTGGYTDILGQAVRSSTNAEEYYKQLTSGQVVWQEGFARPGDVLNEVHARHYGFTKRALERGQKLGPEKEVIQRVKRLLSSGKTIGAWNVEFDLGVMRQAAERFGIKDFDKVANRAWLEGRVTELGDPARRFLYNLSRKGDYELGMLNKELVRKARAGRITEESIDALQLKDLHERHLGFKRLFSKHPRLSYGEFKAGMGPGPWEWQEFAVGTHKPSIRYIKGWRQSVLAEAISPGFLERPTSTVLGREMAKRLGSSTIRAHEARTDVVLSEILNEVFSSKDPWQAMQGYGVKSREQFVTQFKTSLAADYRSMLKTYLAEHSSTKQTRMAYLRRLLSGAEQAAQEAPKIAAGAAAQARRFNLVDTYKGAFRELKDVAYKHPKATVIAGIASAFLLADSFIPEDNRLAGRRSSRSPYTRIHGVTFGGMGTPYRHAMTDFGSGRDPENFSSYVRSRFVSGQIHASYLGGYSAAEVETAQSIWASALSQRNWRTFRNEEVMRMRGGDLSIPGVKPDAWMGVVDLRDYRVKAQDADTISLARKGVLNIFDRPISVRLATIDAPEIHPHQPAGKASKDYLRKLIDQQNSMQLLLDPYRSTYGRHVGVLTGDVHPNMNLKLVSAGAAAAMPFGSNGVTSARAYQRAENIAAASGLGMWSSKGWQAHRMIGMAMGQRIANVSLAKGDRLSKTMETAAHGDLVSSLHLSPKERPWRGDELDALSQVMAMQYRARQWPTNTEIKDHGYVPAINDGTSAWNIAPAAISPSDLDFANVSAFGSGLSAKGAERVLRSVQPLRRQLFPPAEPLMQPVVRKTSETLHKTLMSDRRVLRSTMDQSVHMVDRGRVHMLPIIVPAKHHGRIEPQVIEGIKRHTGRAAGGSGAGTSVAMLARKGSYRHVDAQYSAHLAVMPPWVPPNRLRSVVGPGFPGAWQEKAWAAFKHGSMDLEMAETGLSELWGALRGAGISKAHAEDILERHAGKAMMNIASGGKMGFPQKAWSFIRKIAAGDWDPDRRFDFRAWSKNFQVKHLRSVTGGKNALDLFRKGTFHKTVKDVLTQKIKSELQLRKVVWKNTVGRGSSPLAKLGGFLEFMGEVDNPLRSFTPAAWKTEEFVAASKGLPGWAGEKIGGRMQSWYQRARNWAIGDEQIVGAQNWSKVKSWFSGQFSKLSVGKGTAASMGRGLRSMGRHLGPLSLGLGLLMGYSESRNYDNRKLGLAVEFTSEAANWAVVGATFGAFTSAGAGIGASVGAGIGALFGGVGSIPGAVIGKFVGMGLGWLLGMFVSAEMGNIVGEGVRYVGQSIVGKPRTPSPVMPEGGTFEGGRIPGLSTYGATDQYLGVHGISGSRPDMSGFGGGLKPLREAAARAFREPAPAILRRRPRRFARTSGLVNKVLWEKRHRMTRGGTSWPVQWEQTRRVNRPLNASRMMRAA